MPEASHTLDLQLYEPMNSISGLDQLELDFCPLQFRVLTEQGAPSRPCSLATAGI